MKKAGLKLEQMGANEWGFKYPSSKVYPRKLYEGVDLMDEGRFREAERIFRSLIKKSPEHIDAYHNLALLLSYQGKDDEALKLWEKAVDIGMKAFPENFSIGRDHLEWGWLENRAFLRAYHALALTYLENGQIQKALSIFYNLIALNPNDNQGARYLSVECNFALNRPEEVLKVCDKYPEDAGSGILYGRSLALLQLSRKAEAEKAMKDAIKYLPLIAEELVKTRHRKPKNMMEGYITVGGPDEAYDYWKRFGKFWKKTDGAIDFVKNCLKKYSE